MGITGWIHESDRAACEDLVDSRAPRPVLSMPQPRRAQRGYCTASSVRLSYACLSTQRR